MADINNDFESSQIAQSSNSNFDAEILPNFPQGTKGPEAEAKSPSQDADKEIAGDQSIDLKAIETSGWPTYSGQATDSSLHPKRQTIVNAAEATIGSQPWKSSERAEITRDGLLAGGLNMSAILRAAGYPNVDATHIRGLNGLEKQLAKNGFTKRDLSMAQPGDIYVCPTSGSGSIVGILSNDGKLFSHSSDGTMRKVNAPSRHGAYVLSPPETN